MGICQSNLKQQNKEKKNSKSQMELQSEINEVVTLTQRVSDRQQFQVMKYEQEDLQDQIDQDQIKKIFFFEQELKVKKVRHSKQYSLQKKECEENVLVYEKEKQIQDIDLIYEAFGENLFFSQINQDLKKKAVDLFLYCTIDAGKFVFLERDPAHQFFIIDYGLCELVVNGKVQNQFQKSNTIGEQEILFNTPHLGSLRAQSDCGFWVLGKDQFRQIMDENNYINSEFNKQFLQEVKFLDSLNQQQKDALLTALINLNYKPLQNIVSEGEKAQSYFIILEGTVVVKKNGKELIKLTKNDSFGEQVLYKDGTREATVQALDEVKCLALTRDDLINTLGDKFQVL